MVLVNLSVLSKECHNRSSEALRIKDRGYEMVKHFRSIPFHMREYRVQWALSAIDTWYVWMHLANRVFGHTQRSFVFMRPTPCSIDVCTTHRNEQFNMEVSAQHSMDIVSPFLLFGSINNILQPSTTRMVSIWQSIMQSMLGTTTTYSEVWWRTSPMTFYEVDLAHSVYYQYADVSIVSVNGDAHLSMPYRRTRVAVNTVREHIANLIECVNITS